MQAVFLDFDKVSLNDDVNPSPMRDLPDIVRRFHGSTRPEDVDARIRGAISWW